MDVEDFNSFKKRAEYSAAEASPGLRKGQVISTIFEDVKPNLANAIRGDALLDPYYQDGNLHRFWDFVEKNWDE